MHEATNSLCSRIPHSLTFVSIFRTFGLNAGWWFLSLLVVTAYGSSWDRQSLAHFPGAAPLFAPTGAPSMTQPPSSTNEPTCRKKDHGSQRTGRKKTTVKKKYQDFPLSDSHSETSRSTQKRVKVRKNKVKRSFLSSQVDKSDGRRRILRKETSPRRRKKEMEEPLFMDASKVHRSRKPSPKTRLTKRKKRKSVSAVKNRDVDRKSVKGPTSSSKVLGDSFQKVKRKKIKKIRKKKLDTATLHVASSNEEHGEATSDSNIAAKDSGSISSVPTTDDLDLPAQLLIPDVEEPIASSPESTILRNVVDEENPIVVGTPPLYTSDKSTDDVEFRDGEASHNVVPIQPIDDLPTATPKVEIDSEFLYLPENASTSTDTSEKVISTENELVDSDTVLSQMEITMEISSSIDFMDRHDGSFSTYGMGIDDEVKNATFTIHNGQNSSGTLIQTEPTYEIEGPLSPSCKHNDLEATRVPEDLVVHGVDALSLSSDEISQQNVNQSSDNSLVEPVASLSPGDVFPMIDDSKGVDENDDGIDFASEVTVHTPEFTINDENDDLDDEDDDEDFDADVASEEIIDSNPHENEELEMPSLQVETGSGEDSAIESSTDACASTERPEVVEPSTNLSASVREEDTLSSEKNVEAASGNPDLTVSVVTWNLAEESPLPEDATFIKHFRDNGKDRESGSDLVLISGQECENIKPRRSEGSRSREFRRLVVLMLGKDYVPLAMHLLGGIQFCLFCKRSILSDIQKATVADVTCGIGNVFHNKGAIGCFLQVKANKKSQDERVQRKLKSIRMLFVTAHMAAHVKNTEARDADFWRIVRELEIQAPTGFLPKRNSDTEATGEFLLESMDRIFFCGDLNYRIDLPREEVEYAVHRIRSITESRNLKTIPDADKLRQSLLQYDQLRATIALGRAFPGFVEGPITFAPTFKFDKGTDDYDTSPKQRIPAWTDRILFKPVGTQVSVYSSVETARHSDHRPVFATFLVDMTARDLPLKTRKRKRAADTNRNKK